MKRIIFLFSLLATAASHCTAREDYLARFNEAGRLYEQGRYPDAAQMYDSLIADGQANAALYYNLGNAEYRQQRIGRAVLNYERAFRLAPRDADTRSNLSFIRQMVKEPPVPFPASVLDAIDGMVSVNELTVLCSVLLLLAVAGLSVHLLTRRRKPLFSGLVLLALYLTASGWLYLKITREFTTAWAVIVSGPADVRNGPGTENSVGFTLPEGRKVIMLGEKDDWAAVGLPVEGLKGWVEKKYLEAI